MGRKFLKSESRPGNLSKGVTSPSFQSQGKYPIFMERLIKHVITGRSSSKHDTTSEVGAGSLRQDDDAASILGRMVLLFRIKYQLISFTSALLSTYSGNDGTSFLASNFLTTLKSFPWSELFSAMKSV